MQVNSRSAALPFFSSPACGGGVGEADGGGALSTRILPQPIERRQQYRLQNAVDIRSDIAVPEPQHDEAFFLDCSIAPPVARRRVVTSMLIAVNFNDKSCFKAGEVGDRAADRMLAAKAKTAEPPVPETRPQPAFGFRHVAPKRSCNRVGLAHAATITNFDAVDFPPQSLRDSSPASGGAETGAAFPPPFTGELSTKLTEGGSFQ